MLIKGAEIAARIRGLTAGEADSMAAIACLLDVDETAVRITLDAVAPYPTVDVIAAVVAKYGVDPCWLLSGEYNPEIHRALLASRSDELPSAITTLVRSALAGTPALRSNALRLES